MCARECAKVFGETREQRCWVHKTANVLNDLPKGKQDKTKSMLDDIWMAETQADVIKRIPFVDGLRKDAA